MSVFHVSTCELCFMRNISAPGRGGWDPQSFVEVFVPPAQVPIGDVLRLLFHRERALWLERTNRYKFSLWAANVGTRYPSL